ncbi:endonuclease III domain-containing protein [Deinococcus pimensis]|uniref:endonuclease III domain-containing protein n=1 Tax=Deinococcus pimensis TaxID=309888 RepID=UPI000480E9F8|nr:endonuclease III [Deinococcus pimensis]
MDRPTRTRRSRSPATDQPGLLPEPGEGKPSNAADLPARALEVHHRLQREYGGRDHVPRREPMHELISTILSQRTTWRNEDLAYRRMIERFGDWETIEHADVAELTDAISPSNYAEVKAPNIQRTLRCIRERRGGYDLSFLADMTPEEGMAWLLDLPGVGLKTASLVLLFCFAKPVLPVDTHVHRVSQRVGLIGPKVMHEAAHRILLAMLPPDPPLLYAFHVNMLRHGQKVCTFSRPYCSRCVLRDVCDYGTSPDTVKY